VCLESDQTLAGRDAFIEGQKVSVEQVERNKLHGLMRNGLDWHILALLEHGHLLHEFLSHRTNLNGLLLARNYQFVVLMVGTLVHPQLLRLKGQLIILNEFVHERTRVDKVLEAPHVLLEPYP
jgi:hypothetical protein